MILQSFMDRLPLVAILRGITPEEALPIGHVLVSAGFAIIEVPLNSPRPFESIRALSAEFGRDVLVGAGTVTDPAQVAQLASAGGRIVVMPHGDPEVIRAAKAAGLLCVPGVSTPTEGFAALRSGADALKLFPAELLTPRVLKAMLSVFPRGTRFLPVGGIAPDNMGEFVSAGAAGFGLGSALYKPGATAAQVADRAQAFAAAWRALRPAG